MIHLLYVTPSARDVKNGTFLRANIRGIGLRAKLTSQDFCWRQPARPDDQLSLGNSELDSGGSDIEGVGSWLD